MSDQKTESEYPVQTARLIAAEIARGDQKTESEKPSPPNLARDLHAPSIKRKERRERAVQAIHDVISRSDCPESDAWHMASKLAQALDTWGGKL